MFLVGKKLILHTMPDGSREELILGINDNDVSDNSGVWNVRITTSKPGGLSVDKSAGVTEGEDLDVKATDFEPPGKLWHGRIWLDPPVDFTLSDPVPSGRPGEVRYRAKNVTPEEVRVLLEEYERTTPNPPGLTKSEWSWTFDVTVFGNHLLADKKAWTPMGPTHVAHYEGTISPDSTFVYGILRYLYEKDGKSKAVERVPWWATIEETDQITPPSEVDLNTASVMQLQAIGLSPASARTIAEGRIVWGFYKSLEESLEAPGLTEDEKDILRRRSSVR